MFMKFDRLLQYVILIATWAATGVSPAQAQPARAFGKTHQWYNQTEQSLPNGVVHHRFRSPSMKIDVGYSIYLPPDYWSDSQTRFPVVYWLHGGGGNELTGTHAIVPAADKAIRTGELPPMIIVFVNGGPAWHYDDTVTGQLGETAFIDELIPLVDQTYRTLADRGHRAIEGLSMGGRATTRAIFKYPELFCSAAPLAAGFGNEQKAIDAGQHLDNNVFILAKKYAVRPIPPVRILLVIGTRDFNYSSNLAYMKYLEELRLPFERKILEGVTHSNKAYYEQLSVATLKFHAESFRLAGHLM